MGFFETWLAIEVSRPNGGRLFWWIMKALGIITLLIFLFLFLVG